MKITYAMIFAGLMILMSSGQTPYAPITDLLRSVARMDVVSFSSDVSLESVCGPTIAETGGDTNLFFDLVREYCTNLCVRAGGSDRLESIQYRGAINLLRDYDAENSKSVFAYCATNSQDRSMTFASSLCYSENASFDERNTFFRNSVIMTVDLRKEVCRGIIRGFDLAGGNEAETNKMIALGVEMLADNAEYWRVVDKAIVRWWPAYATSSNRYVAAQRALQADPPCASSNYLARVIAELEALPPGTMQMLSTNHLGQAWGE